jgi:hypothetical protein
MKRVGLADWQTSNGLPSVSDPETEADRTPRESLLACMTANHEPSNRSFEIDREATVCTASRRFLPLCGRFQKPTKFNGPCDRRIIPALCSLATGPESAARRFPPPWSVEEQDACFVVVEHSGQKLAYIYFEEEPGQRSAAQLLTKDEARRIAANIAKLPGSRRAITTVRTSMRCR